MEDEDAADDGRPATERRPEDSGCAADWGDKVAVEALFEDGRMRCCEGSLALIASAKARDISSGAVVWLVWWTVELERDLPGVGIPLVRPGPGIPDCLGLAGVVIAVFKGFQSNERYGKGPDSKFNISTRVQD